MPFFIRETTLVLSCVHSCISGSWKKRAALKRGANSFLVETFLEWREKLTVASPESVFIPLKREYVSIFLLVAVDVENIIHRLELTIFSLITAQCTYCYKHTFKQFCSLWITVRVILSTSLWKHILLVLIWIASICLGNLNEYKQCILS